MQVRPAHVQNHISDAQKRIQSLADYYDSADAIDPKVEEEKIKDLQHSLNGARQWGQTKNELDPHVRDNYEAIIKGVKPAAFNRALEGIEGFRRRTADEGWHNLKRLNEVATHVYGEAQTAPELQRIASQKIVRARLSARVEEHGNAEMTPELAAKIVAEVDALAEELPAGVEIMQEELADPRTGVRELLLRAAANFDPSLTVNEANAPIYQVLGHSELVLPLTRNMRAIARPGPALPVQTINESLEQVADTATKLNLKEASEVELDAIPLTKDQVALWMKAAKQVPREQMSEKAQEGLSTLSMLHDRRQEVAGERCDPGEAQKKVEELIEDKKVNGAFKNLTDAVGAGSGIEPPKYYEVTEQTKNDHWATDVRTWNISAASRSITKNLNRRAMLGIIRSGMPIDYILAMFMQHLMKEREDEVRELLEEQELAKRLADKDAQIEGLASDEKKAAIAKLREEGQACAKESERVAKLPDGPEKKAAAEKLAATEKKLEKEAERIKKMPDTQEEKAAKGERKSIYEDLVAKGYRLPRAPKTATNPNGFDYAAEINRVNTHYNAMIEAVKTALGDVQTMAARQAGLK